MTRARTLTRIERANNKSNAQKNIDPSVKIKLSDLAEECGYTCTCCGKRYKTQRGNFLTSNSILYAGNNGYVTVCRDCVDTYYNQLIGFYSGNEEHAIEHCCWIFDWYYTPELAAATTKGANTRTRVQIYPSKMGLAKGVSRPTYLDTIKRNNFSNRIMSEEDVVEEVKDGDASEVFADKETIDFFGYGYTNDEYNFLQAQYDDWTARHECQSKAQEEIFKNIAVAQLVCQRAQTRGSVKEITDSVKMLQDLLSSANLKPSQNNDSKLIEQNTFGTFIKKIENEKPIGRPSQEWEDVDGVKKYIDTFFFGHLCNALHVENDYEAQYREEMEKYTAKPPVYEEDEEVGETSLLDKYSNKREKNVQESEE